MNRGSFRAAGIGLMGCLLICLLGGGCATNPDYREGLAALQQEQYEAAVRKLESAAEKDPDSLEINIALDRARRSAAQLLVEAARRKLEDGDHEAALRFLEQAMQYDPENSGLRETFSELDQRSKADDLYNNGISHELRGDREAARRCFQSALKLFPEHTPSLQKLAQYPVPAMSGDDINDPINVSFEIKDMALGDVFDALAVVAGQNVLIDDSVDRTKLLTLNLQDIEVNQAMNDIAASCGLLFLNLDKSTKVLTTDTPENRTRYAREDIRLFPLNYAEADRIKELLEPIVGEAVILADRRTNSVVVRTRTDRMQLVADLVESLDIRESEALVEVEILEVSRGKMADIGIDLGDNPEIRATLGGAVKSSGSGGRLTVSELDDLSSGQIFLTVPSLYVKLLKNDSQTRILAQPRLRILNRTPARLHIGEQVPIKVTSSVFRNTSEELSSYSYRDVGILMNLTPRILSDSELALDLKLVVSSILEASDEGHPTIGTREVETTLRLRHGEVEIIAGLIKENERSGHVRIPLLGDVPVLGRLFMSRSGESSQTDIVISLTPHILDRRMLRNTSDTVWRGVPDIRSRESLAGPSTGSGTATSKGGRIVLEPQTLEEPVPDADSSGNDGSAGEDGEQAEASTVVSIEPAHSMIPVAGSTQLQIIVADGENIGSVPFYIDYDPNIIEIIEVREGPFMSSDGAPTAFISSIDERRGRIIIGLSRLGPVKGISGSGVLVEVALKATRAGQSPFAFSHESVLDPMAQVLDARFVDGEITATEVNL